MEIRFCSRYAARDITDAQPGKWHVISIGSSSEESRDKTGEAEGWPELPNAAEVYRVDFDDVVYNEPNKKYHLVTTAIMQGILVKAREWIRNGKSILVHCHAGISRSTATTLVILLDQNKNQPNQVVNSLLSLVNISENIMPNPNVLACGLEASYSGGDDPNKWNAVAHEVMDHRIWRRLH